MNDVKSEVGGVAPKLVIIAGVGAGNKYEIPVGEIFLGRSEKCDICIGDPSLSRRHCKISFNGVKLSLVDLDSANGVLKNTSPVRVTELVDGDVVGIGDTRLRVMWPSGASSSGHVTSDVASADTSPDVVIDLGFSDESTAVGASQKSVNWRPLVIALITLAGMFLAVSMILRKPVAVDTSVKAIETQKPSILPLEVYYEKLEASTDSVFRYNMSLDETGLLSIEIDDLAENRHVRKESSVASNNIARLAEEILRNNFHGLDDEYDGMSSDSSEKLWDITIVSGRCAKRVRVANRVEPERFREIRELLETFGKNELGIWAIQFSREKLTSLAAEAFTRAANLYDERNIAHKNLYESIKRYEEAAFYLETVDPKPTFYEEIVTGRARSEEELNRRYEEQRFLADRAINLQDWATAAHELRILREILPSAADERNKEAGRKLLDVESRLRAEEKR